MQYLEGSGVTSWSETDASGRAHFTTAMKWVENVEHALYRERVPDVDVGRMPRRSVTATFHRPFSSGDRYTARLSVEHVGTSSIRYAWQVLNGNALAVEGGYTVIHVAADGRSAPLPEALRSALQSLQLQPGV